MRLPLVLEHVFGRKCPECGSRGEVRLVDQVPVSRGRSYSYAARREKFMVTYETLLRCGVCKKEWREQKIQLSNGD